MDYITQQVNANQNTNNENDSFSFSPFTETTPGMSSTNLDNSTEILEATSIAIEHSLQILVGVQLLRLVTGGAAVSGNALVMAAVIQNDVLQSPGNILAASLAMADMCHGLSRLLIMVTDEPASLNQPVLCHIQKFLGLLGQVGNIFLILALTVHRFIAIQYSLRYNEFVTVKRVVKGMVLTWILIVIFVLILLLVNVFVEEQSIVESSRCWAFSYMTTPLFTFIMRPIYFSGLAITVLLYLRIIYLAKKQATRINAFQMNLHQGETIAPLPLLGKASRTVTKVLLVYMLTTLPILILDMAVSDASLASYAGKTPIGFLRYVFSGLWFTNCYLNPLIYALSDRVFREKMKATLCLCTRSV